MTTVNISETTNSIYITENDLVAVVSAPETTVVTAITAGPQGAAQPGVPTFIQTTQPTNAQLNGATLYAWWDTSGGDLTLWIEDGI